MGERLAFGAFATGEEVGEKHGAFEGAATSLVGAFFLAVFPEIILLFNAS